MIPYAMLSVMQEPERPTDPFFRASEPGAGTRVWTHWPRCAHCGRLRLTVCPTCGMAGDQFALAEYLAPAAPLHSSRGPTPEAPEEEGKTVLLVCPQCDEAFAPRFYRRCAQCGHDAGSGLEVPTLAVEPLSTNTLLVLVGLLALVALIVLYFRWLFA
jgi:hypothetical protein